MNNKNLLHFIADWLEEKRTGQPNAVRVNDWLPTLGNIVFTLLIAFTLVFTQQAWATPQAAVSTVNPTINYQGRLADSGGVPIDGNVAMSFAIFDAPSGGNLMWGPESHPTVPVADGLFNVGLGSLTGGGIPATVWQGGDRYLQITVAGETLAPRELIRSVPTAITSEHALTADLALTVPDGAITEGQIADGAVVSRHIAPSIYRAYNISNKTTTNLTPNYVSAGNSLNFTCETDCIAFLEHRGLIVHSVPNGRVDVAIRVNGQIKLFELAVWVNNFEPVSGFDYINLPAGTHTVEVVFACSSQTGAGTCTYYGDTGKHWEQLSVMVFSQ